MFFIRLFICLILLSSAFTAQSAVILQYHHVSDKTPPSTSISPQLFDQHLEHIEQQGFSVWPLPKLVQHLQQGSTIPDKVVSITFDDAYESVYRSAFPALKKRNMPFTIFVATQAIKKNNQLFMTWDQLKEVTQFGATIANHTHTHLHLVRKQEGETNEDWRARLREDILRAEKIIDQNIPNTSKLLAYPYGEYTQEVQSLSQELGYVSFGQQSGAVGNAHDLTALPRFPMTNRFGAMKQFKLKLASLPLHASKVIPNQKIVRQPSISKGLRFEFDRKYAGISCFFEGDAVSIKQEENSIIVQQELTLPVGRSRINCTAPSSEKGRYYWYSYAWIRPKANGEWYKE
ncbi:MAG: polysaccharide deacetylase family protein [Oleiphilaceae bacterium]|nr:polysaccharide deacetylase family protein [Oleiphilaceae bacterium]